MRVSRRLAVATVAVLVAGLATAVTAPADAATVPRVTNVNPGTGPKAGGNLVTLTGGGFTRSSVVTFGGVTSPYVEYVSSTRLFARAPAHALGVVHIHVRTTAGLSASTSANRYVFVNPPAPLTAGPPTTLLSRLGVPIGMSCPTTDFCMLVDESGAAVTTDGTAQGTRTVISDANTGFFASGVTCSSPTFCVAWDDKRVRTFDGVNWSAVRWLFALDDYARGLSVDCVSATFCIAIGWGSWFLFDGSDWAQYPDPGLGSLSCVTPTFCMGVSGDRHIWRYNGEDWLDLGTVPGAGTDDHIDSVDCASTTYCLAIMSYATKYASFNGTSWTAPAATNASASSTVQDLSCAIGPECVVVTDAGYLLDYNGSVWHESKRFAAFERVNVECVTSTVCRVLSESGYAQTFNGSTLSAPVELDVARGGITDMDCPSASFCAVVDEHGWARIYNGSGWLPAQRIDPTGSLTSVSCPSASACIAVDTAGRAFRFNGSTWTAPTQIDSTRSLTSVSCPSASFCMAVDGDGYALAYSDGHWHTPARRLPSGSSFDAVSCSSSEFCYAVGYSSTVGAASIRYTGAWGTPREMDAWYGGSDVSCVSSRFCMIGLYRIGVVTYTGASQSRITGFAGTHTGISSVSCVTARFCNVAWITWQYAHPPGLGSKVLDGAALSPTTDAGTTEAERMSTACWAVGSCMVADDTRVWQVG
jgi:hypothetical protein